MGVSGEMLPNLHPASPGTGWLRIADHERDSGDAFDSTALKRGDTDVSAGVQVSSETPSPALTEDPESPRDIVHENVLVLFPLALSFVFLVFGLVIAFSG